MEAAKYLGGRAKAGMIFTLDGDLGAGKTLFTKGFAQGLGISEVVNSPTFTIVQEYESGRLPLYHFDVYRISDPWEMVEIGFDDYVSGEGVCLIEWAKLIEELLPADCVRICIEREFDKGEDFRKITIEGLPDTDDLERIWEAETADRKSAADEPAERIQN